MDVAIDPAKRSPRLARGELAVPLATLEIDGTAPQVGDKVELEVSGTITRIVGKTAYVRPDQISADTDEEPDADEQMNQLDQAYQQSQQQPGSGNRSTLGGL